MGWQSEQVFSVVGFIIIQVCGVREIRKPAFERMVCYSGPRRRGHRGRGALREAPGPSKGAGRGQ